MYYVVLYSCRPATMAFIPSSYLSAALDVRGTATSPLPLYSRLSFDAAQDVLSTAFFPTLSIADETSLSDALTAPGTPYQTFEPQINTPALSAFLFVTIIFGILQIRISQISKSAERRTAALDTLREVKALQLSADDFAAEQDERSRGVAESSVRAALQEYEDALREELSLRQVMPGVRIVAPNDPKGTEADLAAARQFLGLEISDGGEMVPVGEGEAGREAAGGDDTTIDNRTGKDIEKQEGMSNGAKAVLLAVALTQIGLLFLLSFDPMKATEVIFN